jgi:hypothetical protein
MRVNHEPGTRAALMRPPADAIHEQTHPEGRSLMRRMVISPQIRWSVILLDPVVIHRGLIQRRLGLA